MLCSVRFDVGVPPCYMGVCSRTGLRGDRLEDVHIGLGWGIPNINEQ